jgi:hypothetical protein
MIAPQPSVPSVDPPFWLTMLQREALRLLAQASDGASEQARDVWQFAVEIGQLHALGLSNTDLRRLLCQGYLEHAKERTTGSPGQRIFQPLSALFLPKGTCFVLTAKGKEIASRLDADSGMMANGSTVQPSEVPCSIRDVPRWDSEARQLWWQDCLIKEFRRPAINQETILAALEEEGWPARIDDPLPQTPGIDPKIRLHDTIKNLNRHHLHAIFSFRGDGSGTGVLWMIVKGDCEMFPRASLDVPQSAP